MKSADMKFLEAFKRLEAVCNDLFSCQSGVSEYITQMEQAEVRGKASVPDWNDDFKRLKHLRWVRNQIAHSPDTEQLSKSEDLSELQDFYDRVLSQKDPLALLEKSKKAGAKAKPAQAVRPVAGTGSKPAAPAKKPSAAKPEPKPATPARSTASAKPAPRSAKPAKKSSGKAAKKKSRAGAGFLLVLIVVLILLGLAVLYLDLSGKLPAKELAENAKNAIIGLFHK